MLDDIGQIVAKVGEHAQVEGRQRAKVKVAVLTPADIGRGAVIGRQANAITIVEIARLRLDLVARAAAAIASGAGVAMEEVERREAGPDDRLVDQRDGVGERKSQPPALSSPR